MAMSGQQRHQMIERALRPLCAAEAEVDTDTDTGVVLWERLAAELIAIIGERGFASLYARSLNQAATVHKWLAPPPKASRDAFKLLAASLQARAPAEAQAANGAMLNIFIDTLIILIGEPVTNGILRAAWGDDVVNDAGTE